MWSLSLLVWWLAVTNAAQPPTAYELKVDYYERLIETETHNAWTSSLPTSSHGFLPSGRGVEAGGTFDYIVVGAGSAGAVVATRLSELENATVLLLEAGISESDFVQIPGYYLYNLELDVNWNYNSTPQTTSCKGYINHECLVPRGRVTGGTSVLNNLAYTRGNRLNYDQWERAGNAGWSYDDVLPYFKKSENSQVNGDPGYQGIGGYQNVEFYSGPTSPQTYAFFEGCRERGIPYLRDFNGHEQVGVSGAPFNTLDGQRHSTSKAFLNKARKRSNLEIRLHSLVTRVIIENKEAKGVVYSHGKRLHRVMARKEIILSAGSINTPQLLMLSGIGPKAELQRHGINMIQELPVGENYKDHPAYFLLTFETNTTTPTLTVRRQIEEYVRGEGPLTTPGNFQGILFHKTQMNDTAAAPDIELIMVPAPLDGSFGQRAYHYTEESWKAISGKNDPAKSFSICPVMLQPRSQGWVRLRTGNPYDYPLINTNYLSDAEGYDIDVLYKAVKLAIKITQTRAFASMNPRVVYNPHPNCSSLRPYSRKYWYCQFRHLALTLYHITGTARMDPDPAKGVVDPELRVHGISKLRVADASVIPFPVSGHTNAPTIMVGEKASDMIKAAL